MNKQNDMSLTFEQLISSIRHVHDQLAAQAGRAVNISLTLRNWAIGHYIHEYEQNGSDRAQYGERLLDRLAEQLQKSGLKRVESRELRRYRQFYQLYPQIRESVTPELNRLLLGGEFSLPTEKRESSTPELHNSGRAIITKLSFTHLAELIAIEDNLKRVFYEIECMCGNWSVRELKRQIASLYYERSGLSKDKKKLAELVQSGTESAEPKLAVRDPYIFEFLGLKPSEVMSESDLEDQHLGQLNTYISWYKKNIMTDGDNPPVGILLCTQKDHPLVEYALAGMDNQLFVSKYQLELPKKEEMQRFLAQQLKEAGCGE